MGREYYTYMVCCSDGTFYTGWTVDLGRRVHAHNQGRGARYTRSRRPVHLVYAEKHASCADAMRRERAIKSMGRAAKLGLVAKGGASCYDVPGRSVPGGPGR